MHKFLILLLGLVLLGILGYFCIYKHSPVIQSDIDARINTIFAEQGFEYIDINTDGRDITLSGEVASEAIKQQVDEYARNVLGVRTIDNQLTIYADEPKPEVEQIQEVIQAPKVKSLSEQSCQQDFNALLDANQINFTTNSAEIDTSSSSLLSNLIATAKQCPEANIEIGGHTDSRGSDDFNLRLSQERASAVMTYLIDHGIESNRLKAVGYGESNPIADNESAEGLAKNRRIEFNIEGPTQ